jgi:hypothetical protein
MELFRGDFADSQKVFIQDSITLSGSLWPAWKNWSRQILSVVYINTICNMHRGLGKLAINRDWKIRMMCVENERLRAYMFLWSIKTKYVRESRFPKLDARFIVVHVRELTNITPEPISPCVFLRCFVRSGMRRLISIDRASFSPGMFVFISVRLGQSQINMLLPHLPTLSGVVVVFADN